MVYIIMCLIFIVLFFDLVIGYKYYKKIINPLSLFASMFMLSILFSNSLDDLELGSMLVNGLFYILLGVILFSGSFIMAQHFTNHRYQKNNEIKLAPVLLSRLTTLCLIFAICSFLLSLHEVLKISPSLSAVFKDSTVLRMRYLERSSVWWIAAASLFCTINVYTLTCFFPSAILSKIKYTFPKLIIILVIRFVHSLITMSKELFVLYLIFFLSAYTQVVVSKKLEFKFIKKYSIWALILVVGLLMVVTNQRSYLGNRYDSYFEAVTSSIGAYISIPIASFSRLVSQGQHALSYGQICFRPIYNMLAMFGISDRVSVFQKFVDDGGNIFTIFGNMYNDFGVLGIILFSVVFGILFGMIYRKNITHIGFVVSNSIINVTMFFAYYDLKTIQTVYVLTMIYGFLFGYLIQHRKQNRRDFVSKE